MTVKIMDYPVIDNHCHPFPVGRMPQELERMWTLSLNHIPKKDIHESVFFQMMLRKMREYHGFDRDMPLTEVMTRCHQKYLEDTQGYTANLWQDAHLIMIIGDIGSGVVKNPKRLTSEEIVEFETVNQSIEVGKINRIEFFTEDIIAEGVSFNDFTDCFLERAQNKIVSEGLIALKSIIAYRTGLEVVPRPIRDVRTAYEAFVKNEHDRTSEKIVRDYVFLTAAKLCADLDIPLQVHAGAGDSPVCDLRLHDPILLYQGINDPRTRDTRIILLHASYPIVEHASYLASHYPNIYLDVSSMVPYLAHAAEDKLRTLLEMAPFSKLLYGSDGSATPDFLWYGAKFFKHVLEKTLNDFIEREYIDDDFARHAASLVLSENVKRIYKLHRIT